MECWVCIIYTRDSEIRNIIAIQEFSKNLDVIVVVLVYIYRHLVMQILLTQPVFSSARSLIHSLLTHSFTKLCCADYRRQVLEHLLIDLWWLRFWGIFKRYS